MTALMEAATCGYNDIIRLLLDSGANIDIEDVRGDTAINMAAARGHVDTVRFLVDQGALVNIAAHGIVPFSCVRLKVEPWKW